ncbi:MAG: transposase, partial [Candidatus Cloacimonadaceae bacterium]
ILNQVELKRDSVAGRDAYSTEVMFRIMLIQSLYSLSDYQMEDQLICNMMFLWFSHLSMDNPVPDHSTISRWRSGFWEKGTKRSKYTFFSGKLISQLENNP